MRICGDYRLTINQAGQRDNYPLPRIEDMLASLSGGVTFSKLDLSNAYQQVLIDEQSMKYMLINTHLGLFEFTKLPFVIAAAPGIFQRIVDSLLQGIPHTIVYLDDILITGKTQDEHCRNLETVLSRLTQAGLRLKRNKCVFFQKEVAYLGHKIDKQGIYPNGEKVRAIQNAPEPKNVQELRAYLGLINYYGRFC